MTPEREAQMRGEFEKWWKDYYEGGEPSLEMVSKGFALAGFLACARALEPMVRDGERYRFLRDEMELSVRDVFSSWCPQLNDGLDAAIDSAMSAALEDGNAIE